MVVSKYPEVLNAIKELQKLKASSKLVWGDALHDKDELVKKANEVRKVSNSSPCCPEDM